MSVLLEFSMFPTDKGESVSTHVSKVIKMIHDSGVTYQLTPMGTIIETATPRVCITPRSNKNVASHLLPAFLESMGRKS